MMNIEITIFKDGVSIDGTESTDDIHERFSTDKMFADEYNARSKAEQWDWIVEDLKDQISSAIDVQKHHNFGEGEE